MHWSLSKSLPIKVKVFSINPQSPTQADKLNKVKRFSSMLQSICVLIKLGRGLMDSFVVELLYYCASTGPVRFLIFTISWNISVHAIYAELFCTNISNHPSFSHAASFSWSLTCLHKGSWFGLVLKFYGFLSHQKCLIHLNQGINFANWFAFHP